MYDRISRFFDQIAFNNKTQPYYEASQVSLKVGGTPNKSKVKSSQEIQIPDSSLPLKKNAIGDGRSKSNILFTYTKKDSIFNRKKKVKKQPEPVGLLRSGEKIQTLPASYNNNLEQSEGESVSPILSSYVQNMMDSYDHVLQVVSSRIEEVHGIIERQRLERNKVACSECDRIVRYIENIVKDARDNKNSTKEEILELLTSVVNDRIDAKLARQNRNSIGVDRGLRSVKEERESQGYSIASIDIRVDVKPLDEDEAGEKGRESDRDSRGEERSERSSDNQAVSPNQKKKQSSIFKAGGRVFAIDEIPKVKVKTPDYDFGLNDLKKHQVVPKLVNSEQIYNSQEENFFKKETANRETKKIDKKLKVAKFLNLKSTVSHSKYLEEHSSKHIEKSGDLEDIFPRETQERPKSPLANGFTKAQLWENTPNTQKMPLNITKAKKQILGGPVLMSESQKKRDNQEKVKIPNPSISLFKGKSSLASIEQRINHISSAMKPVLPDNNNFSGRSFSEKIEERGEREVRKSKESDCGIGLEEDCDHYSSFEVFDPPDEHASNKIRMPHKNIFPDL